MISEQLHKKPVALDRVKHRALKLDTDYRDMSTMQALNSFFVAVTEFGDACRDYPVVWINAGKGETGKPQAAPVAIFGLQLGVNLCIEAGQWRTRYMPAALRLYPFAMARVAKDQMVVAFDESWPGLQEGAGRALFEADGNPTELTRNAQKHLEDFEQEVERTRLVGELLHEKGLLREMRFDANLPNGEKVSVDGFMTIDEKKLAELPDADLVTLQRNGVLSLIHAHQLSLGHMNKLAEWHVARKAAEAAAAQAANGATAANG